MKENEDKNSHKDWFLIGDEEFDFAKLSFEELDAFYSQICFLCQQAAEKYLKDFYNNRFPKTHDLIQLMELCGNIDKNFLDFLDEANNLSQYYLISRYPLTEYVPASKEQTKKCLDNAEEIIKFIKGKADY